MKQTHAVVAEAQQENALAGITSRKNNTLKEKRSGKKDRHRKKPAKDLGQRITVGLFSRRCCLLNECYKSVTLSRYSIVERAT